MTDNHPLLTLENVMYWYWYTEPKWSGLDIAKEVGCSLNTVYRFMKANNIPIRNHSEAMKNSWQWEDKRIKQFERYEGLTVENVLKWYWKNDPAWSSEDIADHISCHKETVLRFMKFHNIPIRDYIEAGKEMHKCPQKKRIKYHKLTVDNVNQWYWNNNPPWSVTDIAKKIGCSPANVSKFMRQNNIPRILLLLLKWCMLN